MGAGNPCVAPDPGSVAGTMEALSLGHSLAHSLTSRHAHTAGADTQGIFNLTVTTARGRRRSEKDTYGG